MRSGPAGGSWSPGRLGWMPPAAISTSSFHSATRAPSVPLSATATSELKCAQWSASGDQGEEVLHIAKSLLFPPTQRPSNQQTTGPSESHKRKRKGWNKTSRTSSRFSAGPVASFKSVFKSKGNTGFQLSLPKSCLAASFLPFCHKKMDTSATCSGGGP